MMRFWDKSYYGYNRKEKAENDNKWREDLQNSMDQEALPGK
jgi:hypothetical protein